MIKAYHRPETLTEALALLARREVKSVLLAGYDALNDAPLADPSVDEVVDLQALGLQQIVSAEGVATIEALTRLQALVDHPALPLWLREIVRQEAPNTFRNMRTVASVLLNPQAESQLLAALLVANAQVTLQTPVGQQVVALEDYLRTNNQFSIAIPVSIRLETTGRVQTANVARTPADKPIVAAVVRSAPTGELQIALCGVASTPILVERAHVDALTPIGDFRGSSEYRMEMARILIDRAVAALV